MATLTYPADDATDVDLSQPIQWTTVANAAAYSLELGMTAGSDDLLDSGEIHDTSLAPPKLPVNQILYARIHTNVGGAWRYVDATLHLGRQRPNSCIRWTEQQASM